MLVISPLRVVGPTILTSLRTSLDSVRLISSILFDLLIFFGQINRYSLPDLLILGALMLVLLPCVCSILSFPRPMHYKTRYMNVFASTWALSVAGKF
jgi:hypothetical protein